MFWGISLCPGKRYSQVSRNELMITMAALEPRESSIDQMICVMLEKQGNEYLLCTLEYGRVMQVPLNLRISKGEEYVLYISGNGVAHLTGYSLGEKPSYGTRGKFDILADDEETEEQIGTERLLVLDDSAEEDVEAEEWEPNVSDLDDSLEYEFMFGKRPQTRSKKDKHVNFLEDESYVLPQLSIDNESGENESSTEENGDEDCEIDDEEIEHLLLEQMSDDEDDVVQGEENDCSKKRKKSGLTNNKFKKPKTEELSLVYVGSSSSSKKSKKAKKEKMLKARPVEENNATEEVDDDLNSSIGRTPMPKKKQSSAAKSNLVSMQSPPLSGKGSAKKTGKCDGVECEDLRDGIGPIAREGKVVHVYYTGQFVNGTTFEKCGPSEKAYAFRLGRGEVIKGWDVGIEGMRVGGKRRMVIPPHMAYGKKGVGCIPPHSTLIFTVELKAVN